MGNKRKNTGNRQGLQVVTLCISTAMVLILLGLVVFSVLTARNLSDYVKENLTVTMMLEDDMTNPEALQLCRNLRARRYISSLHYVSKQQALKEQTVAMGTDPSEFIGTNPFLGSIEVNLKADYANSDSLRWIEKELKKYPKVGDITYQQDLMDSVNDNLRKISIVLLILAGLLTFVSFSYDAVGRRVVEVHTTALRLPCRRRGIGGRPDSGGGLGGLRLCAGAVRTRRHDGHHVAGDGGDGGLGVPLGNCHYGRLLQHFGQQVLENEGRRTL